MGKSEIYLYIGRAVIALYLFIVFILVLAETIERGNVGTTEPENYKETSQIIQSVIQNLQAAPLMNVSVLDANLSSSDSLSPLTQWVVGSDWCWCLDVETNKSSSYPYFGVCSVEDRTNRSKNCTTWSGGSFPLYIWRGARLTANTDTTWSFPVQANHTCSSHFDTYNSATGLCSKSSSKVMSNLKVVDEDSEEESGSSESEGSRTSESTMWDFVGRFASDDDTLGTIINDEVFYASNQTASDGLQVYTSYSIAGSPFRQVKISRNGMPCLNPSNTPAPKQETSFYPLTGNASTGCGFWNESGDLYVKIDSGNDWYFFFDNDKALNDTFFEDLYKFKESCYKETSYLYAERKLIVNDTDFCYGWVRNPDVKSNIEDIPNLNSMRSTLSTIGFIIVGIAVVAFLAYLIVTRSSKTVSKESVGIYIFWFEHGLGCMYAIVALAISSLTSNIIDTIEADNSYLNEVASAACVTNVSIINTVYSYLADGITALYDYVSSYNDWNFYTAVIFLVLEAILLVCWLLFFQCHENLEDEENVSDTRKLRN